jgi:hypothetical protein
MTQRLPPVRLGFAQQEPAQLAIGTGGQAPQRKPARPSKSKRPDPFDFRKAIILVKLRGWLRRGFVILLALVVHWVALEKVPVESVAPTPAGSLLWWH